MEIEQPEEHSAMKTSPEEPLRNRLTVEYNESTSKRLKVMQAQLGLDSLVQVIRLAVKLLSCLLRENNDGWELVFRKGDREKTLDLRNT